MSQDTNIIARAKAILREEAENILQLQQFISETFSQVIDLLLHCNGRIIISGIGKSAIVGQKIVATLNSTGTPAIFMHLAEAIHGDLGIIQPDDIVLIISNSGNSVEIKNVLPSIQKWGNKLIALTGNPDSYLAHHADHTILTTVHQEVCTPISAPTNSTAAQMAMGDTIAVILMELKGFTNEKFARLHPGGRIGKRLNLLVNDVYPHNQKPVIEPTSSLKEVINSISHGRLGATAVVSANGEIAGIVTDGDVRRMLQKVDNIAQVRAQDILTPKPKYIRASEKAQKALEMMQAFDITQLLVVDAQHHFVGFVHIHDLIKEGLA